MNVCYSGCLFKALNNSSTLALNLHVILSVLLYQPSFIYSVLYDLYSIEASNVEI